MLYDPKWEQTTATPSLKGFIAWLEKQNPDTEYIYFNPYICAVGQYLRSLGFSCEDSAVSSNKIDEMFGPDAWAIVNFDSHATFGQALERARNYEKTGKAEAKESAWKTLFKSF